LKYRSKLVQTWTKIFIKISSVQIDTFGQHLGKTNMTKMPFHNKASKWLKKGFSNLGFWNMIKINNFAFHKTTQHTKCTMQ